jgi:hypothetical protein
MPSPSRLPRRRALAYVAFRMPKRSLKISLPANVACGGLIVHA